MCSNTESSWAFLAVVDDREEGLTGIGKSRRRYVCKEPPYAFLGSKRLF
jgi:hypothetical protein